jgi:hypothetical protein
MKLKFVLAGAVALGGLCALGDSASAMPQGLDPGIATSADLQHGIQDARWVCGYWGGCRWVPWGYYWGRPWGPYRGAYWGGHWGPRWGWGWRRWHYW